MQRRAPKQSRRAAWVPLAGVGACLLVSLMALGAFRGAPAHSAGSNGLGAGGGAGDLRLSPEAGGAVLRAGASGRDAAPAAGPHPGLMDRVASSSLSGWLTRAERVGGDRSAGAPRRLDHWNRNVGALGPNFYKLATCTTCSERNVMASRCKNYQKDMQVRLALASEGRLMESEHLWNVLWLCRPDTWPELKTTLEAGKVHAALQPGQMVNYVPGARVEVFPKDALCRHVTGMWGEEKEQFFAPCYVLPTHGDAFDAHQHRATKAEPLSEAAIRSRHPAVPSPGDDPSRRRAAAAAARDRSLALRSDAAQGRPVWVVKDFQNYGGHGISFYRGALTRSFLVGKQLYLQRLVDPPALIHGRKFDLRLYAFVPSFDPFRVYLYTRGYARRTFAEYTPDLKAALAHITNHDTQLRWARRTDPSLVQRNMTMQPGSVEDSPYVTKWPLRAVLRYFEAQGFPAAAVWAHVRTAVAKTMASVVPPLQCRENAFGHGYPCGTAFHYFGVDVMFDDLLRPYVIEVNTQPQLRFNTAAIARMQSGMVSDVVRMMGLLPGEADHVDFEALRAAAGAPLSHTQLQQLGAMVREYCSRGLFDLAFPDPGAEDWRRTAAKLPHAAQDAAVFDAFERVLAQPQEVLGRIVGPQRPWFA